MKGILKRRSAENAEEVFQKELCGLCDSAFPICKTSEDPNQPMNFRKLVQKYDSPSGATRLWSSILWAPALS